MNATLSSLALLSAAAAAATATATGCQTTESDSVLTRGMYAAISASADGTGSTTVSASLYLGPPSDFIFVDLVGGDQLIAHHETQSKVMTELILLNIVSHTAAFPFDAEGEQFEVELRRDVDRGAPSSVVTLPAPFTLGAAPTSASRAAAFGVTWAGPSASAGVDRMRWSASGSCIESASGPIAGDPGGVTMPAGTFRKLSGQNVPDSCQVTLTVTRERDGDLDPGYGKGGTVTGSQSRSVSFTTTP